MGGKRHGSGRGKKGYYNGIWCDSTYELAYLFYCQDHQIPIKRYEGWFYYNDVNGVQRRYYPDFEVQGVVIEIKGYLTENDYFKMAAVDRPFRLMTKKELAPIFSYVTNKTGLLPAQYSVLYQPK